MAINPLRHPICPFPAQTGIAAAAVFAGLYVTGSLKHIQDAVSRIFDPPKIRVHVRDDYRAQCTPRGLKPASGYVAEDKTMTCNERLNLAIRNVEACPEAKKLLDKLDAIDPICFLCVPNEHAPNGAKTWMHNRTITFSKDRKIQEDPGTTLLVYELKNAENERAFLNAIDDAAIGRSDKHKFIYEIESLEYLSALGHYEIATACKKTSGWPEIIVNAFAYAAKNTFSTATKDVERWKKTSKTASHIKPTDTFEKLYTLMINEKSGHSELVGRTYDQIQSQSRKR